MKFGADRGASRARFGLGELAVLVAGGLTPLAFAPFEFRFLIFFTLGALFLSWFNATPARAAWRGFLFGFASFIVGTSWVFVSLQVFGGMPTPAALIAVVAFKILLSLFPALAGWLAVFASTRLSRALVFPAAWALCEWLRGLSLWAFPWLSAGYSQTESDFGALAPVVGVFGVSFAVATAATLLASVLALMLRNKSLHSVWLGFVATAIFVVAAWLSAGVQWAQPDGQSLKIALVQGNTDIATKWTKGQDVKIRERYVEMSRPLQDRDLIVWPESAMPIYLRQLDSDFWQFLDEHPAEFVFGVVEQRGDRSADGSVDNIQIFNSAVTAGAGRPPGVWRKTHLVPFGEYLPFAGALRWVLDLLKIPMSDFTAYDEPQGALPIAGTQAGISICFEDSFPRDMLDTVPEARILINISEDAWFGDSFGPDQRFEMGQMRAREMARPMLRSSNTGITAVLDHQGRLVDQLPQFESAVLQADVQPMTGTTPFVRFGHWPTLLLCGLLLIAGIAWRRPKRDELIFRR